MTKYTREEREELLRMCERFSGDESYESIFASATHNALPGLLAQIDELEIETERLNGVDLANRAFCEWNQELKEKVAALEKYPRMCENGTHEIAESGECYNCALKVRIPTGRLEAAEADTARLDWRDMHPCHIIWDGSRCQWLYRGNYYNTERAAIDAAKEGK